MNLCRLCCSYTSSRQCLRVFDSRNQKVLENIKTLMGILLQNFMGMPEIICQDCEMKIQRITHFRNSCFEAQIQLMESLNSEQLKLIPEHYKTCILNSSTSPKQHCIIESFEDIEEDIVVEEKSANITEELVAGESKTGEEVKFQIKFNHERLKGTIIEEVKIEEADLISIDDLVYQSEEEFQLIDEDPTENIKPKEKLDRTSVTKSVFICEECGNHISGRKAFDLHCRRHRGEKQFECEICQKAFCTTSEVKRHMRKHTGERPFECTFCNRRFTDYSTRRNHERTHTNERPYVCTDCGKAFTTAYILKNHMLVHSGKRDFLCNLCNKSFLRDTHLTTHYRSHMHKRNLDLERLKIGEPC
ncbi:transcription factor Ouib-like [Drosophila tropicalis]|uniref:transcription factor Ouib-like n=1 Tax=Drosophila tropicalis TaxID=46794 RepID=UPI0035AC1102